MITHVIAYIVLIFFLLFVFYMLGNDIEYYGFWNQIFEGIKKSVIILAGVIAFVGVILLIIWSIATVFGIPL